MSRVARHVVRSHRNPDIAVQGSWAMTPRVGALEQRFTGGAPETVLTTVPDDRCPRTMALHVPLCRWGKRDPAWGISELCLPLVETPRGQGSVPDRRKR